MNYFKYFLIFLSLFLSLIWLSQILRLIDIQYSISAQIFELISTTLLVLPSFINPLLPILLILSYLYFNYVINNNSEIKIINQYLNNKDKYKWILIIKFLIIIIFFINSEIISPKLYSKYKISEIEIRNNLRIGLPSNNELHIGQMLSIFFLNKNNKTLEDVEAVLYQEGQFIKSNLAYIEYDKKGINIIFVDGFRVKLNHFEKSKTTFERFTFNIQKEINNDLSYDKDHFNTLELLNHKEYDFKNSGHKRIYYYLLLFIILIFADKIIFNHNVYSNSKLKTIQLFSFIMILYVLNAFLIYNLDKFQINIISYYIFNVLALFLFCLFLIRYNDN